MKMTPSQSTFLHTKAPGLVIFGLLIILLSACGKKGPLTLPDETQTTPKTQTEKTETP